MKTLVIVLIVLSLLGVGCATGVFFLHAAWKERTKPQYRQVEVTRGDIEWVINSTGTVNPVLSVPVGSVVSGPIVSRSREELASGDGSLDAGEWPLLADFNQKVKKGELLAKIDPRTFQANVDRDKAMLKTREAEVVRVTALLEQAQNDEERALSLKKQNRDDEGIKYISDMEVDKYVYARKSLEAQLAVTEATVDQAKCNLRNSEMLLAYTDIVSPVDGIVIDRQIEPGQTLAAQFQAPQLFVVAPDMEWMYVKASVDEADIAMIMDAKKRGQPVRFTVDAYREELFEGKIHQIRLNPTTVQNVVTYQVVVRAKNPDRKLLPGMTANLSFHIAKHENALRIPNAALRFYPRPEQVRKADRKLLEEGIAQSESNEEIAETDAQPSASQKATAAQERNRRHVWVVEGDFLRAVEVTTGMSDYEYMELVDGNLKEGQKVVVPGKPKP